MQSLLNRTIVDTPQNPHIKGGRVPTEAVATHITLVLLDRIDIEHIEV